MISFNYYFGSNTSNHDMVQTSHLPVLLSSSPTCYFEVNTTAASFFTLSVYSSVSCYTVFTTLCKSTVSVESYSCIV